MQASPRSRCSHVISSVWRTENSSNIGTSCRKKSLSRRPWPVIRCSQAHKLRRKYDQKKNSVPFLQYFALGSTSSKIETLSRKKNSLSTFIPLIYVAFL